MILKELMIMGKEIQSLHKKYGIILFGLSFIVLSACSNRSIKIKYYKSGKVECIDSSFVPNDTTNFYRKKYYKNGYLKSEYSVKNNATIEGSSKLYYNDGSLWWEGEFKNSVIQHQNISKNWTWPNVGKYLKGFYIEGNPEYLLKNQTYQFRVIMPQIHPQLYIVVDKYFNKLDNTLDSETYQYCLHTGNEDHVSVFIVFMDKDGVFTGRNPNIHYEFPLKSDSVSAK